MAKEFYSASEAAKTLVSASTPCAGGIAKAASPPGAIRRTGA